MRPPSVIAGLQYFLTASLTPTLLVKSFIKDSVKSIKNVYSDKAFFGHIKGVLETKKGNIRFNLVSEKQEVNIKENIGNDKIQSGELKIVFIFYNKNISENKKKKLKRDIEQKISKVFDASS